MSQIDTNFNVKKFHAPTLGSIKVIISKIEYLGHIMRNSQRYGLLQIILQEKVDAKREPRKRRIL